MARAKNEEFNQIKYQNEFKKANYDRVEILVKKGERAIIKEIAAAAGQNVSEYINQAIKERMERDQRMTAEEEREAKLAAKEAEKLRKQKEKEEKERRKREAGPSWIQRKIDSLTKEIFSDDDMK